MPDILHNFPINAPIAKVFEAVSMPAGLECWWTLKSSGQPVVGSEYQLFFGPEYDWRAKVIKCVPGVAFKLEIIKADEDWRGTHVGFSFKHEDNVTHVQFSHTGWREDNDHYRTSCYCWAMYLRVMKRYLEFGETVPYENRLDT